jgi:hypothetical protein
MGQDFSDNGCYVHTLRCNRIYVPNAQRLTTRPHIHGVITEKNVVERYGGLFQPTRRYYIVVTQEDKRQTRVEVDFGLYGRVQSGDRFDRE